VAEKSTKQGVTIRRAKAADAERIAQLSGELGYPATSAQIAKRLHSLRPAAQHAVFIAESQAAELLGWLHVSISPLLELDRRAEINALVVTETARGQGIGAQLLAAAESWSKKKRCHTINLRSNVLRKLAHKFYLRHGYEHCKTQKAFRKQL
jgi:GNAT superfamily N-acetyltransferase